MNSCVLATTILLTAAAHDAPSVWRIGLATARITPEGPMPMCGYGPRISDGALDDLHAKATAVAASGGNPAVLVTADLLFFRRDVGEAVAGRIMEKTGLKRNQILLNASHTHSGPVVGINGDLDSFGVPADQRPRVTAYTRKIEEQLSDLAVAALRDMQPARLSFGVGRADFVMNRRLPVKDAIVMAPNPEGPVDRSVPVLRVEAFDGRIRALVFGCACHPVTLDGNNKKISADYAGYAQAAIERRFPGAQAMFVIGCGADANSHPRGTAGLARQQGDQLAAEVARVAGTAMQPVRGPLRPELAWIELPLVHDFSRPQLQAMAAGSSVWHARNAKGMLNILDAGKPLPNSYRAPLAVWQFGDDLTLVALSGEAVADYASRIARVLGPDGLWVAAYSNESFGYLPTARMLKEGGHESMCLTLDIGIFAPRVEDTIIVEVRKLAEKAGRRRAVDESRRPY
jgi:neutral ceramidase